MKEKVEDEVVEVETVTEEVEEKGGGGEGGGGSAVAEGGLGDEGGGGHAGRAMGPGCLCSHPTPRPGPAPPRPPESRVCTLRFLMQLVHPRISGQGRWVWVDPGGGSTGTSPGGGGGGGGLRVVGVATGVVWAEVGGDNPPGAISPVLERQGTVC